MVRLQVNKLESSTRSTRRRMERTIGMSEQERDNKILLRFSTSDCNTESILNSIYPTPPHINKTLDSWTTLLSPSHPITDYSGFPLSLHLKAQTPPLSVSECTQIRPACTNTTIGKPSRSQAKRSLRPSTSLCCGAISTTA